MRFTLPTEPVALARYLPEFMALVGVDRWVKRADQLANEMKRSPYLHRIVLDYHWLEMNVCHQWEVLTLADSVDLRSLPELNLAALNFAATTVEVHKRLGEKGKRVLAGRLLDALQAETGFAALYLELSLVQRLLSWHFDIELPDMEGTAQYDLLVSQGNFSAEVECKSQSADAGRQIHRKHFYRFMASLAPERNLRPNGRREIVLVTLTGRLHADLAQQASLAKAVNALIDGDATSAAKSSWFELRKLGFDEVAGLEDNILDPKQLQAVLKKAFGEDIHVAGWQGPNACLLVMRSAKADDPSAMTLEAMRKGASQLSKTRPGFLAVQDHGMEPEDLFLPHVQRRAFILSSALFGHYKARHVNAVYVTGYGAVIDDQRALRTPGFAVTNMLARRRIPDEHATALLTGLLQERPQGDSSPT